MYNLFNSFEEQKLWELKNSSLAKISDGNVSYDDCRRYSCEDIVNNMTKFPENMPFIIDIAFGTEFHFIGRVDTTFGCKNIPEKYYGAFERRTFISFSTINNKNISHYKGNKFFIYDILPDDIAHIFPMDSDIYQRSKTEEDLTIFPSLWLTLKDLNDLTLSFEVYNQITCKTKRNGKIIKPFAVVAFDSLDEQTISIAKNFGISCVIVHPDHGAINYESDVIYDYTRLRAISDKLEDLFDLSIIASYYLD